MWEGLLRVSFCLPDSKAAGWPSDSKHSLVALSIPPGACCQPGSHPPSLWFVFTPLWWGNGVKCTNPGWGQCNSSVTVTMEVPHSKGSFVPGKTAWAFWQDLYGGKLRLQKTLLLPVSSWAPGSPGHYLHFRTRCMMHKPGSCFLDNSVRNVMCFTQIWVAATPGVALMIKIFPWLKPRVTEACWHFYWENVHVLTGYPTTRRRGQGFVCFAEGSLKHLVTILSPGDTWGFEAWSVSYLSVKGQRCFFLLLPFLAAFNMGLLLINQRWDCYSTVF